MAWFICKSCGKEADFSLRRGFKIADQRCECGGQFGRRDWNTGGTVRMGPSANAGKKAVRCAVCSRSVFKYFKTVTEDCEKTVWRTADGSIRDFGYDGEKTFKIKIMAGDKVCTRHYNIK